jgi:hypothetical protein
MFAREDVVFKEALERVLNRILYGDREQPGLHQGLRASQTWEMFQRTAGRIEGLELALKEMDELEKRMNGDERERDDLGRVVN